MGSSPMPSDTTHIATESTSISLRRRSVKSGSSDTPATQVLVADRLLCGRGFSRGRSRTRYAAQRRLAGSAFMVRFPGPSCVFMLLPVGRGPYIRSHLCSKSEAPPVANPRPCVCSAPVTAGGVCYMRGTGCAVIGLSVERRCVRLRHRCALRHRCTKGPTCSCVSVTCHGCHCHALSRRSCTCGQECVSACSGAGGRPPPTHAGHPGMGNAGRRGA